MSLISKVIKHLKQGTFLQACKLFILEKKRTSSTPYGDTYYGGRAELYEESRKNDPFWQNEEKIMRTILAKLPMGLSVFDIPFGTGRFVPLYLERNMQVSGLELSKDMIAQAQKSLGDMYLKCDVQIGDARSFSVSTNNFDLVVCFRFLLGTISFGDVKIVIENLSKICGQYAIFEFCVGKQERSTKEKSLKKILWDQLNQDELSDLLASNGFKTIEVIPIYEDENQKTISAFLCEKH